MEATECVNHRRKHGHGRGVRGEPFKVVLHRFVEMGVVGKAAAETLEFLGLGEPPDHEQPGDFDEIRIRGEFFYRDAAVAKDALVAVDVRDCGLAGAGVSVTLVEGDVAGVGAELGDIEATFALGADDNGEFNGLAING